jgi:hypothetical protein
MRSHDIGETGQSTFGCRLIGPGRSFEAGSPTGPNGNEPSRRAEETRPARRRPRICASLRLMAVFRDPGHRSLRVMPIVRHAAHGRIGPDMCTKEDAGARMFRLILW